MRLHMHVAGFVNHRKKWAQIPIFFTDKRTYNIENDLEMSTNYSPHLWLN
jgi:hypothetical protein